MNNYYLIYKYSENSNITISTNDIKKLYPFVNKRDFKLFNSEYNSDIAQIITRDQAIIIKLNDVSAILFQNDIILFSSFKHDEDNFIRFFKTKIYNNETLFSLWCFEIILLYLSNYIDKYLEDCSFNFSHYSIDNFKSSKYVDILKFQHSLLVTKNNFQEIFESLVELTDDEEYKYILFENINHTEELEKILDIYTNQIKEDNKNLQRFITEVETFIDIANLKLADTRNKIAMKSIYISFTSLIFIVGTYSNTLLGTNLKSGLEDIPYFAWYLFLINIFFMVLGYLVLAKIYQIKYCCKC